MLGRRSVLFVEDNKSLQGLVEVWLELAGYKVFVADDGVEGMDIIRRKRPDLVVTDAMMPNMSGDELVEALKDEPGLRDIPVIMTTAAMSQHRVDRMLELGCHTVMGKPLDETKFLKTCEDALESAGLSPTA